MLKDDVLKFRAINNLSQTAFAELVGVHKATIGKIEKGFNVKEVTKTKIILYLEREVGE